jgi:hypothetical protein
MAETNLWKWLKPYCPQGRYSRIESLDTAPGHPDVSYRIREASGTIELKDARSKRPTIPFPDEDKGLHRSQINWIRDEIFFGGLVWIVARVGPEIFWLHGKHYSIFNGATLVRLRRFSSLVMDQSDPAKSVRKIKQLLEGDF